MNLKNVITLFVISVLVLTALTIGLGSHIGTNTIEAESQTFSIASRTEENPYLIEDVHDLQNMNEDLEGHYALANDIDASETEEWNDGRGFIQVGNTHDPFDGKLEGRGYDIKGLFIHSTEGGYVGLFSRIGTDGVVSNVTLMNINITEESNVRTPSTGGIVGRNQGTINNSYVKGNISGRFFVGGLVGSNDGVVKNSYATGEVSGTSKIGGLVGTNNGNVENSYATTNVRGDSRVGGLVGDNGGTVNNSYAIGNVYGDGNYVGGFAGYNSGTVENSYATGEVNGNNDVGGFVGLNEGTIPNSFWNIETSGQDTSEGGIGLTTDEMTGEDATDNMDGFDFSEVWETVEENDEDADEDGYPILQELSREEQLKAQNVYAEEEDESILDEITDIPGFTLILLLSAVFIAGGIYKNKKR